MGKSYVENSLKRFLKRKVKITLGFVVAFMITGVCAFAEGTAENHFTEHNKNFITAEDYLTGLNNENNKLEKLMTSFKDVTNGTEGIKLEKSNNKIVFEKFRNNGTENIEISLKNENISNVTAQNIKTALENGAKNINKITKETMKKGGVNDGIISLNLNGNDTTAIKDGSSTNNGIIVSYNGQKTGSKNIGINNGIIIHNKGQYANWANESIIYNNGIIYAINNKDEGQGIVYKSNKSTAINNGIIINSSQAIEGGNQNKIYNYGVIENGYQVIKNGPTIDDFNIIECYGYNYGIINAANNKFGQIIEMERSDKSISDSHIKNYGVINGNGQKIGANKTEKSTAENYGVIKIGATGTAISVTGDANKGFNYGTVIVENATQTSVKVFEGDVTNNGIVILDKYQGTDLTNITLGKENNGLVFKKENGNYSLLNKDTVAEITEITDKNFAGKTTAYVTGTGNKIENLSDKVVGAVVKDDISEKGAVITSDKDLTLENTVITGYFENKGTLLDMGSHNLSLLGDTKLVASKDNFDLKEVYALNIDGTLKLLGNAEIAGKITGTGKIQEVAVNGDSGKHTSAIELDTVLLQNATEQEEKYLAKAEDNFTEVSYADLTTNQVILDFDRTAEGKENTITFTDNLLIKGKDGVAIDGRGTSTGNNINLNFSSLDNEKVKGDILLGASDDDIVVERNGKYDKVIDMGAGNDSFTVNGFADGTAVGDKHHKEAGNTFDYKVNGAEKIVLNGKGWHIGDKAELNSGTTAKAGEKTELHIADNSSLHVDMNNDYGKGKVTTSLDKMAGGADLSVTTGKDAEVKFTVGDKFNVSEKQFDVATNYDVEKANVTSAVIFKTEKVNGKDIRLTVKDATEYNEQLDDYKSVYDAMLGALSSSPDLKDAVNYSTENKLVGMIKGAGNTAEAFYTTGYAVTKDVTDTYMSVVDDFGRKAGKGEWIAYGKYVNSDTEFDGGKASKGYDGDITGTVGMLEYGVDETTSYGVVYGQGDTKVDIQGGGKLDRDNTYFGGYVKHRTQGGFDLTGNVGYTKSELDLNLATSSGIYNMITSGKSDADALTFALKGKKDYFVTDTVKLQPVFGARYTLVTQDAVESSDANFRMDEQDVTIFEGMFGGNAVKEFDLYNGKLSLSVGAEYVLADVSKSDDARYTLYGKDIALTGEEDIADSRIEGHIGIDYKHESGVGVDAKYEMIWTDKVDNSRVTAGVSYRF